MRLYKWIHVKNNNSDFSKLLEGVCGGTEEWTDVGQTTVSTKSPLLVMMINQRSPSSSLEGVLQNHLVDFSLYLTAIWQHWRER